jgi:Anti-sigma factor NepR
MPASSESARPTGLTTEIQARIGHQLRAMYDEVVRQGVPDRFAALIRRLDEPGAAAPGGVQTETEGSQ